jgi:hypothetical protein
MSSLVNWMTDTDPASFEGGEFRWCAIETRYRFEKRVVQQLARKGVETFCQSGKKPITGAIAGRW